MKKGISRKTKFLSIAYTKYIHINFYTISARCTTKFEHCCNGELKLINLFIILTKPCTRSDWSKTYVLSEYKTFYIISNIASIS